MNPLGMFTWMRVRASALVMLACLGCRSQERSSPEARAATLALSELPVVVDGRPIPVGGFVVDLLWSAGGRRRATERDGGTPFPWSRPDRTARCA